MNFSTRISEFEPPIPNPQYYIKRALALYDETKLNQHGKIIFVVGEPGSDKSEIMRALVEAFKESNDKPTVVVGSFSRGGYKPFILAKDIDLAQTSDFTGNFLSSIVKIVSTTNGRFYGFNGTTFATKGNYY